MEYEPGSLSEAMTVPVTGGRVYGGTIGRRPTPPWSPTATANPEPPRLSPHERSMCQTTTVYFEIAPNSTKALAEEINGWEREGWAVQDIYYDHTSHNGNLRGALVVFVYDLPSAGDDPTILSHLSDISDHLAVIAATLPGSS